MKRRFFSPNGYLSTAGLCATQAFDGNLLIVFAGYGVRLARLFVMMAVFRSLPPDRLDDGMSLSRMLTYTLLSSAFREQLFLYTPATTALWEGSILPRYTRPLPVIGGFMAETVGKWVPSLLFFTLPVCAAAPLFGVSLRPASLPAALFGGIGFALAVSLSFAVDFIFAAFAMRLKDACWFAMRVRDAVSVLLSGALIPFALLPGAVGNALSLLPFGSLASAPLSLYVGTGSPLRQLGISLFWNAVLWPCCILFFRKSQERMISFGG